MTLEFVDTNVLLYAYDEGAGERRSMAIDLVERLGTSRRGAISVQVLQEFYVNVTRKCAVPLTASSAQSRLRVLSRWAVHTPAGHDVVAAASLADSHQLSFWDSMILLSASRMRCEVLWSEDLNTGQVIEGVEIRSPFT